MSTTAVKCKPILFSGEMVNAIIRGEKTVTRRVVKLPRWAKGRDIEIDEHGLAVVFDPRQETHAWILCPYADIADPFGEPHYADGRRLWVREAWGYFGGDEFLYQESRESVGYRATHMILDPIPGSVWRPSIFMPRWASRITLEIVNVRVERLQEITEEDAIKEGCKAGDGSPVNGFPTESEYSARSAFSGLWDALNKPGFQWSDDPLVWRVEFRRIEG